MDEQLSLRHAVRALGSMQTLVSTDMSVKPMRPTTCHHRPPALRLMVRDRLWDRQRSTRKQHRAAHGVKQVHGDTDDLLTACPPPSSQVMPTRMLNAVTAGSPMNSGATSTSTPPVHPLRPRSEQAKRAIAWSWIGLGQGTGALTINLLRHRHAHLHQSQLVQLRLEIPHELVEHIHAVRS